MISRKAFKQMERELKKYKAENSILIISNKELQQKVKLLNLTIQGTIKEKQEEKTKNGL